MTWGDRLGRNESMGGVDQDASSNRRLRIFRLFGKEPRQVFFLATGVAFTKCHQFRRKASIEQQVTYEISIHTIAHLE